MSLAILFHFLFIQHVSDINISIIRSWLFCWITTSVVLFSVRCVLEIWCGWIWVVSVLQAEAQLVLQPATRTPLVLHPVTRTLLVLQPATRTLLKPRLKHNLCFNLQHGHYSNPGWSTICASASNTAEACYTDTTQTQPHQIRNTQRTKIKTTDVVTQQHSRKLLMMDILMSETCWVHKKWNKTASDIKLVFHSSTKPKIFSTKRRWALTMLRNCWSCFLRRKM